MELMNQREPIDTVLAKPQTSPALRAQLQLALQAREFASRELSLPDNASYRTYVDLGRPFAVWNVIATPEFSTQPHEWCFIVAGCASYRGYFNPNDAREFADELRQQGMDVYVGGVWAYSTLGYFDDPLLSSMLRQDEAALVGVIFHELAHQLIYVKNDTGFNEAFATAVEQEGVRRWFARKAGSDAYTHYLTTLNHRAEFYAMLQATQRELQKVYRSDDSDAIKRQRKMQRFSELQAQYQHWQEQNGDKQYEGFMKQNLNNAHLAIASTYHDQVPYFLALLASVNGDLPQFYAKVRALSEMDKQQRHQQLAMETVKR